MRHRCREFSLVQTVIRLLHKINLLSLQEAGCPGNQGVPNCGDLCPKLCGELCPKLMLVLPQATSMTSGVSFKAKTLHFFIHFTFTDLQFWLAHQVNRVDVLEAWQLACVALALIKDLGQSIGKQRVSVTKGTALQYRDRCSPEEEGHWA